jgi:hypothetical protein
MMWVWDRINLSNVSSVLVQFSKRRLAKCLTPNHIIGRVYDLTQRGKTVRKEITRQE